MHQIALHLSEYDCFFSQLYSSNPLVQLALKGGLLEGTVLGKKLKQRSDNYLQQHNLPNDYATTVYRNRYDMAVLCSDLIIDKELQKIKTVFVQEGMTDPITPLAKVVHKLGLPPYFAKNTALNGSTNACDLYCAASEEYKEQFAQLGTDPTKIFVTGIPNYDNIQEHLNNDFPHRDYVLVATSDIREVYNKDDRQAFIANCVKIAAGRQLIFKLHPNEIKERAIAEIKKCAPTDTLIFTEGNTYHMIANCEELITQYSTVVYAGIVLGKKVHSYFDLDELYRKVPLQNGGRSAEIIADLIRSYLEFGGSGREFLQAYHSPLQCV